jgi:hypothetical protein
VDGEGLFLFSGGSNPHVFFGYCSEVILMAAIQKRRVQPYSVKRTVSNQAPLHARTVAAEADYARAQKILESMLNQGLISLSEFDKITALKPRIFSPALAEIMP